MHAQRAQSRLQPQRVRRDRRARDVRVVVSLPLMCLALVCHRHEFDSAEALEALEAERAELEGDIREPSHGKRQQHHLITPQISHIELKRARSAGDAPQHSVEANRPVRTDEAFERELEEVEELTLTPIDERSHTRRRQRWRRNWRDREKAEPPIEPEQSGGRARVKRTAECAEDGWWERLEEVAGDEALEYRGRLHPERAVDTHRELAEPKPRAAAQVGGGGEPLRVVSQLDGGGECGAFDDDVAVASALQVGKHLLPEMETAHRAVEPE